VFRDAQATTCYAELFLLPVGPPQTKPPKRRLDFFSLPIVVFKFFSMRFYVRSSSEKIFIAMKRFLETAVPRTVFVYPLLVLKCVFFQGTSPRKCFSPLIPQSLGSDGERKARASQVIFFRRMSKQALYLTSFFQFLAPKGFQEITPRR